jgi:hypothetical protein
MLNGDQIVQFLDGFVPKVIQENPRKDMIVRLRARALVAVLGFSIVVPLLAMMVLLGLQLCTQHDFSVGLVVMLCLLLLVVIQQMLFQAFGNLQSTATVYSGLFFVVTALAVYFTGGWTSPALLLFFCTPVLTHLISGYYRAIYSVAIVFCTGIVFFLLHVNGFEAPQIMREENRPYVMALIWLISSLLLILLFSFQRSLVNAIR